MAIDVKDQITHGHVRRVQAYSVSLARHLGVNDVSLIKAIEAASLLLDMGKLAIPEHILNKLGKLSPAEFEIMKTHAGVGSDLLAAIEFPYPVVPIVRHHHESWDGTGYPDRLSGTEIPIGARILSVVDCFDALTSDRPYRSKLADADALTILKSRRGIMYDPLVINLFIEMYGKLNLPTEPLPQDTVALTARLRLGQEAEHSSRQPRPPEEGSNPSAYAETGFLRRRSAIDESTAALHVSRGCELKAMGAEHLKIPVAKCLSSWVAPVLIRFATLIRRWISQAKTTFSRPVSAVVRRRQERLGILS